MTMAVTSTEDVDMTVTIIGIGIMAGLVISIMVTMGLMAIGNEVIMPRRRASVSFSHPPILIPKGIASRRQSGIKLS